MLTNQKDLRKVLKDAERCGWIFSRHKKHIKGTHPSGKIVSLSATPSDHRAINNISKDLRL